MGRGNEEWCGSTCKFSYRSTYKYSYKSTYKYLEFFRGGEVAEGECEKGVEGEALVFPWFFVGFRPGR